MPSVLEKTNIQVELVSHLPKGSISGIGRYVRELNHHLQDHVDVTIKHFSDPPLAKRFPILHNFPTGIENHQPGAIVHFTQIMGCAQMLWRTVSPTVATVHDLGVLVCDEDKPLFDNVGRRILDMHIAGLKRADVFAVNSRKTRDDLVKVLGVSEERIHFVQLGVDFDHFRPIEDSWPPILSNYQLQKDENTANLLYVGSELPRKNLEQLLKSLAILKQRGIGARLLKVGGAGGRYWREVFLAKVDELNLRQNVIILDVVSEQDLPHLYNIADVCVTPTLLEGGFAWLAMEAMACAKPVVATREALIPTVAGDAAIVVNSRDALAMANAIEVCLEDRSLAASMGEAGRRIIQDFSWNRTVDEMLEVYTVVSSRVPHE